MTLQRLVVLALGGVAASASLAAPDEDVLGKSKGYPIGNRGNWFNDEGVRVGSFSNLHRIMPHHVLAKSGAASPLPRGGFDASFRYSYGGQRYSVDDYLDRQRVTGLLIAKDGRVLLERYQYDRKDADKLLSNSMAKSPVRRRRHAAHEPGDRLRRRRGWYSLARRQSRNVCARARGVRLR
jgi:hypothetical protein